MRIIQLYRDAYSGLPRIAWILALAEFVNRCGTMVFFFLNIYLTTRLNFTLSEAGLVLGAYGTGAMAGSYLGGWLCDSIGAYRIQKLSFIISGTILITVGYVSNFLPMFILMCLNGISSSAFFPASDTALSRLCQGEVRTKGFALRRLATNLGITIGPVAGGFLVSLDYRLIFWADGLTSIAAALCLYYLLKNEPEITGSHVKDSSAPSSPWKDLPFLGFIGILAILMIAFSQLFSTFPLYMYEQYSFPEKSIGPLFSVNTIIIVLFEMILLHSLRKKSVMHMVIIGSVLIGVGLGLLPLGRGFFYAAFTVVIWTIGEIITFPVSTTVVANRAGANPSRYMGIYSLTHSLSFLFAPIIGNAVYGTWGGDFLWMCVGIVALLCSAGFYALRNKFAPKNMVKCI